ncbi:methyl-accepting chemotaxis protein/aerotaxis receptor [Azospirillum agricola]|uniref:methyl-accepting chemotaxis protein n=1 Tax=Azospirillum agricola TaxID=1720247 RepID=UPI001AE37423|nr:methyl-accepting chemotaxis protein [Azospirillum agricola]MBP2227646.1 methyl-accepting chemotaxis protein/aerotaxis receptor [Azospirillum agricola]
MRRNLPVTNSEVDFPADTLLVSRTDTKGRITFVNKAFVEISGFTEQELIHSPHNLVRHPDMPQEAFGNLWKTIQAGRPWEGLVKNRAKNGDHYWVKANVTPVAENGAITGYISIRSKPSREEIDRAEEVYRQLRSGTRGEYELVDGHLVRRGPATRLKARIASVSGQLVVASVLSLASMGAIGGIGLSGMSGANQTLHSLYDGDVVQLSRIATLRDRMQDDMREAALPLIGRRQDGATGPDQRLSPMRSGISWLSDARAIEAAAATDRERSLAARLADQAGALETQGLERVAELARAGQAEAAARHLQDTALSLFEEAHATLGELAALQVPHGRSLFEAEADDLNRRVLLVSGLLLLCLVMATAACALILRSVQRPQRQVERHLDAIARGDLLSAMPYPDILEFARSGSQLRAVKAKLAYANQERTERQRQAEEERQMTLDMAKMVEQEAANAVLRVVRRTGSMAIDADGMAKSAERVVATAQDVSAAAGQALDSAQTVASATEELSVSIREITAQIAHSSNLTRRAVEIGEHTQERIQKLSDAVGRVGNVVGIINRIASQTNLLALNATIEASHAGDAGRGFAVVAHEVKELANQTARSTETIARQIEEIQAITGMAVAAVSETGGIIAQIDQVSGAIAAAMEEQSAATQEISRNILEASNVARGVSLRINDVSQEAIQTGMQAKQMSLGTVEVAGNVTDLQRVLTQVVGNAASETERAAA